MMDTFEAVVPPKDSPFSQRTNPVSSARSTRAPGTEKVSREKKQQVIREDRSRDPTSQSPKKLSSLERADKAESARFKTDFKP